MPKYRKGYPPIIVTSADGVTVITVHKREDGEWGWTAKRGGRKVGTNGQGLQRVRAIEQAIRTAGTGCTWAYGRAHGKTIIPA
jgi:hypothetical protein